MNDKSFVRALDQGSQSEPVLPKGSSETGSRPRVGKVIIGILISVSMIIFFVHSNSYFGYKYLSAYNNTELSEVASDYGIKLLNDRLNARFDDIGEVELVSIYKGISGSNFGRYLAEYEISYRHGNEIYDFTVSDRRYSYNESIAWIDMSEPEDIRVYIPNSDNFEHEILREYSENIKDVFQVSTDLVVEHVIDRNEWKNTFKESDIVGE